MVIGDSFIVYGNYREMDVTIFQIHGIGDFLYDCCSVPNSHCLGRTHLTTCHGNKQSACASVLLEDKGHTEQKK